ATALVRHLAVRPHQVGHRVRVRRPFGATRAAARSRGLATATAVWVASMKGVAQFGGRVVEIFFGRNLRAITVGRIAVGILPVSLLLLLTGTGGLPMMVAFPVPLGASQGVMTILPRAGPLPLLRRM